MEKVFPGFRRPHVCKTMCSYDARPIFISINKNAVDDVLDTYGPERVAMVLAATIQTKSWDGRFSPQNKDWAFTVKMPDSQPEASYDRRDAYAVTSHPAMLDGFINLARKEIQERSRASVREELKMPAISTLNPISRPKEMEGCVRGMEEIWVLCTFPG